MNPERKEQSQYTTLTIVMREHIHYGAAQRPKRGGDSGRGIGAETDYGGARRGGASYDGASWGEAGRSGTGRDNDLTKRGEAGRGEIMTERSEAGIQLNPRNFPEFEFY